MVVHLKDAYAEQGDKCSEKGLRDMIRDGLPMGP